VAQKGNLQLPSLKQTRVLASVTLSVDAAAVAKNITDWVVYKEQKFISSQF
jgi:hypothetical protein